MDEGCDGENVDKNCGFCGKSGGLYGSGLRICGNGGEGDVRPDGDTDEDDVDSVDSLKL